MNSFELALVEALKSLPTDRAIGILVEREGGLTVITATYYNNPPLYRFFHNSGTILQFPWETNHVIFFKGNVSIDWEKVSLELDNRIRLANKIDFVTDSGSNKCYSGAGVAGNPTTL